MKSGGLLSGRINGRFDEQIVDHQYRVSSFVIYIESRRKYRYAFTKEHRERAAILLSAIAFPVLASVITLIPFITIMKRFQLTICSPRMKVTREIMKNEDRNWDFIEIDEVTMEVFLKVFRSSKNLCE